MIPNVVIAILCFIGWAISTLVYARQQELGYPSKDQTLFSFVGMCLFAFSLGVYLSTLI